MTAGPDRAGQGWRTARRCAADALMMLVIAAALVVLFTRGQILQATPALLQHWLGLQ